MTFSTPSRPRLVADLAAHPLDPIDRMAKPSNHRQRRSRVVAVSLFALLLNACAEPTPPALATLDPEASAPSYRVTLDPADPLRLQAQLDFGASAGEARTVFVRGADWGLNSQVREPRCPDGPLAAINEHHWTLPAGCQIVSWSIELQAAEPNRVDAAQQASLYFEADGWWLLSEPTALLRLYGENQAATLPLIVDGLADNHQLVGGQRLGEQAWRLPPLNSAPEFFAFGALALRSSQIGVMTITHVVDDAERFARLPLIELHGQALAYLTRVFQVPPDLAVADRHLLVIWLGIDERIGEAGGAAGSRSFVANYVDGGADGADLNAARSLLILAHEQAHQLHDLMWRGGPGMPTWMGESLAHYYGLQALAHSDLPPEIVAVPMGVFIDVERPIEAGLIEYQRRHEAGDPEAYAMFYVQGASFWSEVNRVLLEARPDDGGLDALMPLLLSLQPEGVGLPVELEQRLLALGGEAMRSLLLRYL